jgi:hypothetical protein
MANNNAPFGMRVPGRQNDATPSFQISQGKASSANTTKFYRGDILKRLNTGYVDVFTGAIGSTVASGRDQVLGIFWGCEYLSIAFGRRITTNYWPGGDATGDVIVQYIPINGFPSPLLVAQSNGSPFTFADIGLNLDIAYAAGTAYTGYSKSGVTLNQSTLATTAGLPFRLIGLWSDYAPSGSPGTDNSSNYNWGVVQFNSANETGI